MDGAIGSELIKRGLTLPEHIWSADANIKYPEMVQQIHQDYINAGADYITANTFRTTARAYEKVEFRGRDAGDSVKEAKTSLNKAVELAKKAANDSVLVIGSIAPLEDCYMPQLFPGKDIALSEFFKQGESLSKAGINILLLETMNSISETEAGLIALQNIKQPLWVSFVLKDENHLLSGDSLIDALNLLTDYQVDVVLLNCNPLIRTMMAVDNIVDNWPGSWGIYPNLGKGSLSSSGDIVEHETMKKYISIIDRSIHLGASIVGACCGSSPRHIAEIKKLQFYISK